MCQQECNPVLDNFIHMPHNWQHPKWSSWAPCLLNGMRVENALLGHNSSECFGICFRMKLITSWKNSMGRLEWLPTWQTQSRDNVYCAIATSWKLNVIFDCPYRQKVCAQLPLCNPFRFMPQALPLCSCVHSLRACFNCYWTAPFSGLD